MKIITKEIPIPEEGDDVYFTFFNILGKIKTIIREDDYHVIWDDNCEGYYHLYELRWNEDKNRWDIIESASDSNFGD